MRADLSNSTVLTEITFTNKALKNYIEKTRAARVAIEKIYNREFKRVIRLKRIKGSVNLRLEIFSLPPL